MFISIVTLLVTTGFVSVENGKSQEIKPTELVKNSLSDQICKLPTLNKPKMVIGATGGLVNGNVVICGGFDEKNKNVSDTCTKLFQKEAGQTSDRKMLVPRVDAASAVINGNLWVTGGTDDTNTFADTEFIYSELEAPNLPLKMKRHCIVATNDSFIVLIGDLLQIKV